MKLKPDQLKNHFAYYRPGGIAPVYLVSGDEPLQVGEACDVIRARARELGYGGREVMYVETGFDWGAVHAAANSLSLFSERRIIELRLPTGKAGDAGSKALVEYAQRPADDAVLLVITSKLDKAVMTSKWVGALDKVGVVVQVWPVEVRQLPAWITQRMRAKGMQPDAESAALLAERVEGNLLAAAQEIEKLFLLHGSSGQTPGQIPVQINADAIAEAVVDSARFDVYGLVDSALAGDAARAARMLNGLRSEGVEPVLVLWALAREIRSLAEMAYEIQPGAFIAQGIAEGIAAGKPSITKGLPSVDQVMAAHRVWDARKPLIKSGLKRNTLTQWQAMLRHAGQIDRIIKGVTPGNIWNEMLQLVLLMTGTRFPGESRSLIR